MNSSVLTVNIHRHRMIKLWEINFYPQPEINILALVQCHVYAQALKVMMKGDGFAFAVLADEPLRTAFSTAVNLGEGM